MDREKRTVTGIASLAVGVVLILLGISMITLSVFLDSLMGKINRLEEQETLSPEQIQEILAETDPIQETEITESITDATEPITEATEQITEPTIPTEPEETEPKTPDETQQPTVNILLIGQDRRMNQTRQRSDAMILCTINSEKKTIVLTSFLRDTYVKLPGSYGKNRLNVPYLIGGFEMLDQCLEENFGVQVDHNIEVDFSGFKSVIDAIGGIEIELTDKEAKIIEGDQVVGMNHLDGGQALMYARIRKIDDDFERTNRQRKVLTVVFEKIRAMNLLQMQQLSNEVLPMITTDLTDEQIFEYVLTYAPMLDEFEIITQSVPDRTEFEYQMIDGMSVVIPDMNKIRNKLEETIGS